MKKIVAVIMAAVLLAAMCSCSKKDNLGVDAVIDYYTVRCGEKDMTEKSIEYVGTDSETGKMEFRIENEELGISETLYAEEWGSAVNVYNEEGSKVHVYNPSVAEE